MVNFSLYYKEAKPPL